eukprot:UN3068
MDGVENVIQLGLKSVSDEGLQTLLEIMDTSKTAGRKGSSEERIIKTVPVMFPHIAILERGKVDISMEIEDMMTKFLDIYVEEYSTYSAGAAKLNNEQLIKHVEKDISIREAFASSGAEPAARQCTVS